MTAPKYSSFWKHNLEKLDVIQISISKKILALEKKYSDFEDIYFSIEEDLKILSSLYSSFNNIQGNEHLMKLNSLIKKYGKRYTRKGVDFELINFLLNKISTLRDESFENFPVLDHLEEPDTAKNNFQIKDKKIPANRPFKWITFERNRSWFISGFRELSVKSSDNFDNISYNSLEVIKIKIADKIYNARNLMAKSLKEIVDPKHIIIINEGESVFAASSIGKTIFSKTDFVTKKIKPFSRPIKNTMITGRIKLFGKNHLYISGIK